jgi:hypothetical protein
VTSSFQVIGAAESSIELATWEVQTLMNSRDSEVRAILTVEVDLANNVFGLHGANEAGKPVLVQPRVPLP